MFKFIMFMQIRVLAVAFSVTGIVYASFQGHAFCFSLLL